MRIRREGGPERRAPRTTDDPSVEGAFRELRATVASLKGQVEAARSAAKKAPPVEKRALTAWERFQGFYVIAAPAVSLLMGVIYALWKSPDVGYPWPGESFWQDDHVQTALGLPWAASVPT